MNVKSKAKQRVAQVDAEINATAITGGVSVYSPKASGVALPEASRRIKLRINSDIRDLKEGRSETVSIWGQAPQMDYVSQALADRGLREEVTDFFLQRRIASVIEAMIPTFYFKPKENTFSKPELYESFRASGVGEVATQVLMELLCGPLTKIGILSSNGDRSVQLQYPFRRVTTEDLAHEINVQQVESTLGNLNLSAIESDARQTRKTFADRLGDVLRPIGVRLLDAAELSSVMDDFISCTRAHIAPYGLSDADIDAIPKEWREHASIADFATCLPFVRAALRLPSRKALTLRNEGRTLDQWIRIIVNYLRDSRRYKWLGREAMLRHHTTRHVRDMRQQIQSVVVFRNVKTQAVAQAVVAIEDVGSQNVGGMFITATKDRLADSIQAAYSQADFSTEDGARAYLEMARDIVGIGYRMPTDAILVDAVGDGASIADIAALLSDNLEIEVDGEGAVVASDEAIAEAAARDEELNANTWDPKWWYTVATIEANLDVRSGRHYGDHVVTCDPIEALKAHAELTSIEAYPAQPQQLGPNAFLSTLVGFKEGNLVPLDSKFKFAVPFAGRNVSGAFMAQDFATLRSARLSKVVRPHFNAAVIMAQSAAYGAASNLLIELKSAGREDWATGVKPEESIFASLQRRLCVRLLKLSQSLSPAFRAEVQEAMVGRALAMDEVTTEDLVVQRAQLMQQSFTAIADVVALMFFLHIQGIHAAAWDELITSDVMAAVCLDYGSDRKPRA